MLLKVYSTLQTFKTVHFKSGLNVLLSDKSEVKTPTDKEVIDDTETISEEQKFLNAKLTRNSAGKTSLIEIIHFLFGAECKPDALMRTPELIEETFSMDYKIGEVIYSVMRSGSDPSKIYILNTDADFLFGDDILLFSKSKGLYYISNDNWKLFLGKMLFGLYEHKRPYIKGVPNYSSFRCLFPYFARRNNANGFNSPVKHFDAQKRADWQVSLSYLLGFDYGISYEFEQVRTRENAIDELKKIAKAGTFGSLIGTAGEIRPRLTLAQQKVKEVEAQLRDYKILESYKDLSSNAAHLRDEMKKISRNLVTSKENLAHLVNAQRHEDEHHSVDLKALYEAVGIELPTLPLKRYEQVKDFYKSVIQNRKIHLNYQIQETEEQIGYLEEQLGSLDHKRSGIIQSLEGRGALDGFVKLQDDLSKLQVEAERLAEQFKTAELLEGDITQLEIDRNNLKLRLQTDLKERHQSLDEAIIIISSIIQAMYSDRTGEFIVEATNNGPEFRIKIDGDRGGGISNIEIFCLDIALFTIVSKRLGGPKFLIHDSHLFDGVDERQIATALLIGQQVANAVEGQYIVAMNSDIFDRLALDKKINREEVVIEPILFDLSETGGLFGMRIK